MRRSVLTLAALLLSAPAGFASGGLSCEANDANLNLTVESSVTRGMGGPFFNFKASAEIMVASTHPSLKKLTLDESLVHHWLDGKMLYLSFYRETAANEPHAYVEIVVETSQVEEGSYAGKYSLSVFAADAAADTENPKQATGEVICFAE